MLIGLTEHLEIVHINVENFKSQASFKNWICHLGRNYISINSTRKQTKLSQCGNSGNVCEKDLCWCGSDLEFVKGVNDKAISTLEKLYAPLHDKRNALPKWNKTDAIMALGFNEFLINQTFHIEWNINKLCNLDCSYCPETVHDNYTPNPSYEECIKYFEENSYYISLSNFQDIRITITGGEPTLIKHLNKLVNYLSEFSNPRILTNGTCNIEKLIDLHESCELIISMHPEYLTKKQLTKIVNFLQETPYNNMVIIKFYGCDEEYLKLKRNVSSNERMAGWVYIRQYPLIDKSDTRPTKYRNYKIRKID